MRKFVLILCLGLAIILSGCAKGEITLEVDRLGSANINCNLQTHPLLGSALTSFKTDFEADGFVVEDIQGQDMIGFNAHKHYAKISDTKDSKVLQVFNFATIQEKGQQLSASQSSKVPGTGTSTGNSQRQQSDKAQQPLVTIKQGLLMDTVSVNTHLNLAPKERQGAEQEQWIMQNIMKQVQLRFVLKLPTATDNNNATRTNDNGKILEWDLPLGVDTPMRATVTYVNPYKAAGWAVAIVAVAGIVFMYKRRKNKGVQKNELLEDQGK